MEPKSVKSTGRDCTGSSQDGEVFGSNKELDAPWLAWLALDETCLFEGENHLMNRRWRDLEVSLHVGLGGWPPHDAGLGDPEPEPAAATAAAA